MIEPKIGEIFSLHGMMVKTCPMKDNEHCEDCAFAHLECTDISCYSISREDSTRVIFKEVEQTKIKSMEVKIQIPDNCELIKDGDTYIVREKKQIPPKSWKEFCERYPVKAEEHLINSCGNILKNEVPLCCRGTKTWCTSEQEAEAFLALMQLRQLRKAWVGDWRPIGEVTAYGLVPKRDGSIEMGVYESICRTLLFPTKEMAADFFDCFRDLCETAKILL